MECLDWHRSMPLKPRAPPRQFHPIPIPTGAEPLRLAGSSLCLSGLQFLRRMRPGAWSGSRYAILICWWFHCPHPNIPSGAESGCPDGRFIAARRFRRGLLVLIRNRSLRGTAVVCLPRLFGAVLTLSSVARCANSSCKEFQNIIQPALFWP